MAINSGDSAITVVREAVLDFLEEMKKSKRIVEQEIRDQSDSILGQYFNQGLTQFTRANMQDLSKKHRDAFTDYYQNIIFLRIISEASKNIKLAIEDGFSNPELIQEEWLEGIDEIKAQLSHMHELAESIKSYKDKIDEQEQVISQLQNTSSISSTDMELYKKAIDERDNLISDKDQLLIEKEQEIMNLTQGLAHMEDQSNNIGETLLQSNLQIEELQEVLNDKDIEIESLKTQLRGRGASDEEVVAIKTQLQEAENTIRRLEQQATAASADLVNDLEDSLEKTRSQLLELRREVVQKNEKIHNLEVEKDEINLNSKTLEQKLTTAEEQLVTASKSLEKYEGKESISAEEKMKISSQIGILEDQVKESKDSVEYLSKLVGSDIKFRTLFYLQSLNVETRIDNLSQGLGVPGNIVHRVLMELEKDGKVSLKKDGRHLYTEVIDKSSPFKLVQN